MIIRGASLLSRAAVFFTFLFALTACGGGGGGGVGFFNPSDPGDFLLDMVLLDAEGNPTSTITASSPGTLLVTVPGGGANLLVGLDVSIADVTVLPEEQNALTDQSGVATFQLLAGETRGAGVANATAEREDGVSLTGSLNFQVGSTGLRLGSFDTDGMFVEGAVSIIPTATLSATGNAVVSVTVVDQEGQVAGNPEEVNFTSSCAAAGQASLLPANPVISINGVATVQYLPNGCTGNDQVSASLAATGAQASGVITVAAAQANNINFVSADPELIVLKGTGGAGRDETSDVVFNVTDDNGAPLSGIRVEFSLSTQVGGLALAPDFGFTDTEGNVQTTVSAGDVSTSVRVIATLPDGNGGQIATASDRIIVSTGLPDQNSISLSVSDTFVVEDAMDTDGLERTITVRMADKFNNPVVDGTAAVFTTEYGSIDPSCQTGVSNGERASGTPESGSCSVLWTSQEPRFPTLTGSAQIRTIYDDDYECDSHNGDWGPCPDFLGYTRGGRSTILVHAIGEESFIDRNGSGVMEEAERDLFDNLPEASIDHNEDGVYTPEDPECLADPTGSPRCAAGNEETFVDFGANNQYDFNDSPAIYNGLLCPPEGDGVWCSRELVNVRDQNIVILSDDEYRIIVTRGSTVVDFIRKDTNHTVYIADTFNNPLPGGTTVSYQTEGNCEIVGFDEEVTGNTNAYGASIFGLRVTPGDAIDPEEGTVTIELDPPEGTTRAVTYTCEGGFNCENDLSPRPSACPPLDPNSP